MENNDIMAVGLGDGSIFLYKINLNNQKNSLKHDFIEEVIKYYKKQISCIKAHSYSVIGIGIQYSTGYVFSCAEEKVLVISEMNYQSVMKGNKIDSKVKYSKFRLNLLLVWFMIMTLKEYMYLI